MSLSLLRNTATAEVYGVPTKSKAGAMTIGAMRSDSGVAGPREVKALMVLSPSVDPKKVKKSAVEEPTEMMFFAVAGGGT